MDIGKNTTRDFDVFDDIKYREFKKKFKLIS